MNGDWLVRGRDGRLCVSLTSGEAVLCRAEHLPVGAWRPARRTGGEQRLHPVLAVGPGADGYAHLVSWRPPVPGESGPVHSTHFRPLLAPLDWVPIGHPDKKGDRTGVPAVAVDAEGRAHVFVRNAGAGLSMVAQKERGGWDPWRDLKGSGVQGPPVAVTGESGRVEAYAATDDTLLHWRQAEPAAPPARDDTARAAARPGTLRALATSAGRTTLFFTDASSGELCAWRPGGATVPLLPAAGPGRVAAVRCLLDGRDSTVLAQRAASGRVALAAYPTEEEGAGASWTEHGPGLPPDAEVALTLDHTDRVTVAALEAATGRLLVARAQHDGPGVAPGPWQEA
ncbi:hypothetical protein [Streptomyces galbus]|uniref:PLL-like beta propeller domain-containing protein n=1 Tax=Streptomyces galbus TaxID=33898 RepID=A0ABX1IN37_STRGB|nr:hypothetical protein [Streptomyces galbus]NKQ26954.1 hypothetical protein [Streptomyces galbus]